MATNEDNQVLVTTSFESGVLILTMDKPQTGNALDMAMTNALADALESAARHPHAHCVLLRSSGKHFCTGGNVKDMQSGMDLMAGSVEDVRRRLQTSLHRITRALVQLEIPSVCAVNGAAVGAGFDLTLMCDIRVVAQSATFAESFLRLGLVSGIGGTWFLARIVGPAKAMELTLTSEFLDAPTAVQLGIANLLVEDEALDAAAFAMAVKIAANPPIALRMAKRLVRESAGCSLTTTLEMAADMQASLLCGAEHKETVGRFIAQRASMKRERAA